MLARGWVGSLQTLGLWVLISCRSRGLDSLEGLLLLGAADLSRVSSTLRPCSVAGGELFERIVDDDFEHTEPSSAQYLGQILEGLQFMHGQAIVHLDLKPENIVCVSPGSHWLKIIDFGLARKLSEQSRGPGPLG